LEVAQSLISVKANTAMNTLIDSVQPDAALLTAEQLAATLQVSKRTLWRMRSAGQMPRPIRIGGVVRWRRDEVAAWIAAGCPAASPFQ
jgi:prophage regulatory protein